MNYNVIFEPEATSDLNTNWQHLEDQRAGLGYDFLSRVTDAVFSLETYAEISEMKGKGWRRVKLDKFNYHLWYKVFDTDVVVLHIAHGHQSIDFIEK
jgi:mRNA-degrading endonuclease RelE of RelBE toxin-antitoxin system